MDPIFVVSINGIDIYRLAFGGYSVKCAERLIEAFETIEEALLFAGNQQRSQHG